MSDARQLPVRVAPTRAVVDEWALVLAAEGLHPRIAPVPDGFTLAVPAEEAERAATALATYERENPSAPAEEPVLPAPVDAAAGLAIFGLLLIFFTATGPRDFSVPWFERGSADAERILAGEPWRAVTALTLHADLGHSLGNALAGTLFVGAVCGTLGVGLGGAVVLAAGTLGNLANAIFHGSQHSSVGASTAIFGAVGILAALEVTRHRRRGTRGRRALAPIAAGLGLLAMLGTSARADLWGHLLGLLAGALIGLPCARAFPRPPGALAQWLLGAASVAVLLACWALALG